MREVQSAQNSAVQCVRQLVRDPVAYRKLGRCWLEGEHLVTAARSRGVTGAVAVVAASARAFAETQGLTAATDGVVLPDALWTTFSPVPPAQGIGWLVTLPETLAADPRLPTVVLDRLQDAGNVGSILRSAAALGVQQVIALRGTAGLWSPKVLRAGMGAHWALRLVDGAPQGALDGLTLVGTSSHGGVDLPGSPLPHPCAWLFGNEGQGVSPALLERCALRVRIPQPGGEESLNAAAAAAICLYEGLRQRVT
jgi:TrmH family RNA methyltransferase